MATWHNNKTSDFLDFSFSSSQFSLFISWNLEASYPYYKETSLNVSPSVNL